MSSKSTIKLPMYNCQITVIITDDVNADAHRIYKKHKIDERFDDSVEGVLLTPDIDKYYLLISTKYLTYNTISHEIFHAVVRVTEDREIQDEETRAWLMGHLAGAVYKFLDKKKFVIKHG